MEWNGASIDQDHTVSQQSLQEQADSTTFTISLTSNADVVRFVRLSSCSFACFLLSVSLGGLFVQVCMFVSSRDRRCIHLGRLYIVEPDDCSKLTSESLRSLSSVLVFAGHDSKLEPILVLVLALARGTVQRGNPAKAEKRNNQRHLRVPRYIGLRLSSR